MEKSWVGGIPTRVFGSDSTSQFWPMVFLTSARQSACLFRLILRALPDTGESQKTLCKVPWRAEGRMTNRHCPRAESGRTPLIANQPEAAGCHRRHSAPHEVESFESLCGADH